MPRIFAVESSCDESSIALLEDEKLIFNLVLSQTDLHSKYGGVVPEIASRRHLEVIPILLNEAVEGYGLDLDRIDAIAVTKGPGLIGALLVGITFAKSLAYVLKKPLIGVNHLIGHIYSLFLTHRDLSPPIVVLLVSGGHTELILMKDHGNFEVLGRTLDDAAGEAFDKVARILNLGYPGGPQIDRISKFGNPKAHRFPRALMDGKNLDFSFSGLKTSVKYFVQKNEHFKVEDVAASFQEAVVDVLIQKSIWACEISGVMKIGVAGGVSANSRLRERMSELERDGFKVFFPSKDLCIDNAGMIARAALEKYKKGEFEELSLNAIPYLSID